MPELQNDLFLLMLSLSRMRDRPTILRLFVEALGAARGGVTVHLLAPGERAPAEVVDIATPESNFGQLALEDPGGVLTERDRAGFRNAIWMLAVVLENIARAERLATENARLDAAVASRTEELQRALEASQDLYHNAPCGYHSLDADEVFVQVNDTEARWLGYRREELIGKVCFTDLVAPESKEAFLRAARRLREGGTPARDVEIELLRKDGTRLPILGGATAVIAPDGRFVMSRSTIYDLSERRRAERALRETEERFRQSQKLEAIGRLAGGVAHDFNNLLTVILNCSESLLAELPADHPLRGDAADIDDAGRRAAQLTRQLLAFGRRHASNPAPVDLGEVVGRMEKMLRRLIGEDVELVISREPDLQRVCADPSHLEQVVLNLVVNARDAIASGGRIGVEATNAGSCVRLCVSDTGCGMAEDVRAHLFEPFFTTKQEGRGTGLGLATVYGIVKQAGGDIHVESEPGRGTRFAVLFPSTDLPLEEAGAGPGKAEGGRGGETVLLVEDDPRVRAVAALTLRRAGYEVLEAGDGEAALEVARRAGRVDALVTDLVMPRLGGGELAARLRAQRSGLAVVFMSGYARQAGLPADAEAARASPVLTKPFTASALTKAIRESLDGRSSSAAAGP